MLHKLGSVVAVGAAIYFIIIFSVLLVQISITIVTKCTARRIKTPENDIDGNLVEIFVPSWRLAEAEGCS